MISKSVWQPIASGSRLFSCTSRLHPPPKGKEKEKLAWKREQKAVNLASLPNQTARAIRIRKLAHRDYYRRFNDRYNGKESFREVSLNEFYEIHKREYAEKHAARKAGRTFRDKQFQVVQQFSQLLHEEQESDLVAYETGRQKFDSMTTLERSNIRIYNLLIRLAWQAQKGKAACKLFNEIRKIALTPYMETYRAMFSGATRKQLLVERDGKIVNFIMKLFPQMFKLWQHAFHRRKDLQLKERKRKHDPKRKERHESVDPDERRRQIMERDKAQEDAVIRTSVFVSAYEDYVRFLFSLGEYEKVASYFVLAATKVKGASLRKSGADRLLIVLSARILDHVDFIKPKTIPQSDEWRAALALANKVLSMVESLPESVALATDAMWVQIEQDAGSVPEFAKLLEIRRDILESDWPNTETGSTSFGKDGKFDDDDISDEDIKRIILDDVQDDMPSELYDAAAGKS